MNDIKQEIIEAVLNCNNELDKHIILLKYKIDLDVYNFIKSNDIKWFTYFYNMTKLCKEEKVLEILKSLDINNKNVLSFLTDIYNTDNLDSDDDSYDSDNLTNENISEIDEQEYLEDEINFNVDFVFRENQLIGINNEIKQGFLSGIHCQIMGSGKSIMMLKTIDRHFHLKTNKERPLYILMTERMEILSKLFYNNRIKDVNKIEFWKRNNIINLDEFDLIDCINIKPNKNDFKKIIKGINRPTILLINNSFFKARYFKRMKPELIILDECHSITGNILYKSLHFMKYQKKCSIIGFSATPLRPKSINSKKYLCDIFSKTFDEDDEKELNIISTYNLIDGIKDDIILPFYIIYTKFEKSNKKNNNIDNQTKNEIMVSNVLNGVIEELPYKKLIAWCGNIENMALWYNYFNTNFKNYKNYYTSYKSTGSNNGSSSSNTNYIDNYFNDNEKSIMCCVNKFKEGSDILNLDCGLLLDGVKNRNLLTFLQCAGRIMRPDEQKLKTHAYIIDVYCNNDGKKPDMITVEHVIEYYKILTSFTFQPRNVDEYKELLKIINNTIINKEKKTIKIKIDDNKKHNISINFNYIQENFDWSTIKTQLNKVVEKAYDLTPEQKFKIIIDTLKELKIFDINCNHWKVYREIEHKDDLGIPEHIQDEYKQIFDKNTWYQIMEYDTSNWYGLNNLIKFINNNKITNKNEYKSFVKKNNKLPPYPNEFYRLTPNYIDIKKIYYDDNNTINLMF